MSNIRKHILSLKFLLLLTVGSYYSVFAQLPDKFKARMIIDEIAKNTNWTNETSIKEFHIGVYGHSGVTNQLKRLAEEEPINGKDVVVKYFKNTDDITSTQILYVPHSQLINLAKILKSISFNTLLITDQCPSNVYMINFKNKNINGKSIDISPLNAKRKGITFSSSFISKYGKEADIKRLVTSKQKEYNNIKKQLEQQQIEYAKTQKELDLLKGENLKEIEESKKQKEISKRQNKEIQEQLVELAQKEELLKTVEQNLVLQQNKLNTNQTELNKQKAKQSQLADSVAEIVKQLDAQKELMDRNEKLLAKKNTDITEQSGYIKNQRLIMLGFAVFLIAIVILAYYIWRSYRATQKINSELNDKNIAINKQKEEIFNQNQQTILLNKELEKLSIVAAQTDNAVTIMDADGNFEWVNVGYTKMYGYTLQLLKNERGDNLLEASTKEDIEDIFNKCKSEKQTVVYETQNTTRKGKNIWIQINLTPILDSTGNINKLITVGIDISRIKEVEAKLRSIHDRILNQSKELEATNKELEKLSLVARETDNAIAIMDIAGNYQWINEAYSRLYGYSYSQLISEYSGNIISKDSDPSIKKLIKKCIEEEVSVSFEEHKTQRNGGKVWVHTTLTPIKDKESNSRNIISISQNIEELKESERAIIHLSHELEEQHHELLRRKNQAEELNNRIAASISYARTIQETILPIKEVINQDFNSFIIYKPKDIVSGDFYWHTIIQPSNDSAKKHLIAAVDCTGHGVPGAFMSMIGHRLLNEIVKVRGIHSPDLILDKLNALVKKVLRQEKNRNNDGMDVCLCSLEKNNDKTTVTFAGAKRPLYYYRKKQQKLLYIKGTRKSIGGTQTHRNQEDFTNHELILEKGDCVYLSTDGIIDQPSPQRIRYGSIRFRDLITDIANKPLEMQQSEIENSMLEFRGDEEQRDDVTLIGMQV